MMLSWLFRRRRIRKVLSLERERLYRQLRVRRQRAWCSFESRAGQGFTVLEKPEEVVHWDDVREVFGRKDGRGDRT